MNEATPTSLDGRQIILGVTGSIAAYKAAPLIRLLTGAGAKVQVLMTRGAEQFISRTTLGTLSGRDVLIDIFPSESASAGSWTRHVELGLWGDLFVVAPATAQTIAKLANGFCDSMLTATALSARCPLLVCPAMDHDMYGHPATRQNLKTLQDYGHHLLPAEYGELASGLVGDGRLPDPEAIVEHIASVIKHHDERPMQLAGKKVLVTAGPTRERIDPARHLSNPSSGRMGFALADAAAQRGADVILVSGPTTLSTPSGVHRVDVETADEMHQACMKHADADLVLMAAAVSDYRPKERHEAKIKKGEGNLTIELERTPDILKALSARKKDDQYVLGFALETNDGEANARRKLQEKGLDWIALNIPEKNRSGFASETNEVLLIGRNGTEQSFNLQSKKSLAEELVSFISGEMK